MKFDEVGAITIPKYKSTFVYFLILADEVVYVGQTTQGITRPFAHKDKRFDTIKIIYCEKKNLDMMEDFYIKKYQPLYNIAVNYSMNYSLMKTRNKIRDRFSDKTFTIPKLKRILKKLGISIYSMNCKSYIGIDDYMAVVEYIDENGVI